MKIKTVPVNAHTLSALSHALAALKLKVTVQAVVTIHVQDGDDYIRELAVQACSDAGVLVTFPKQTKLFEELKQ